MLMHTIHVYVLHILALSNSRYLWHRLKAPILIESLGDINVTSKLISHVYAIK